MSEWICHPRRSERHGTRQRRRAWRTSSSSPRDLSDFDETAEPEAYDFITTFDAIHDQAKPLNVLRGIHRALKADGVYLMQDIRGSSHVHNNLDHPIGTFLYTISCMHCMTVSLAQGGEGLGAMWGEEKTREYLQKAGFRTVRDPPPRARHPEQLVRRQEVGGARQRCRAVPPAAAAP